MSTSEGAAESPVSNSTVQMRFGPEVVSIYSNAANVRASLEEITLAFGERNPEDVTKADALVQVYLSLPHAKRLALALARLIEAVESDFGVIDPDPAGTVKKRHAEQLTKGAH